MAPLIMILVVAGVVFGAWAAASRERDRVHKAWSAAGRRLGLDYRPDRSLFFSSNQVLIGQIQGVDVKIDVRNTGGENNQQYTRYQVRHRPVGPAVTMKKQSALSFMSRLIGRKDVRIGDPFFDDRVVVDSRDEQAIRQFLTPTRRAAVLDLFATWPRGEFTQNGITIESRNVEKNSSRLTSNAIRLVEIAGIMGVDLVDAALANQSRGDLAEAVRDLHAYNEKNDNVFSQMLEAEALVDMGRHSDAAVILHRAGQTVADDPTIDAWAKLAASPEPPPPPRPPYFLPVPAPPEGAPVLPIEAPMPPPVPEYLQDTVAPVPEVPPRPVAPSVPESPPELQSASNAPPSTSELAASATPVPASLDQQALIDDLFDAERMSWEIVEYFEKTYQNAQIDWVGELTSFHTYRHDLDFGDGPGVKATVLLGRVGRSEFISSEVHAMLQLPEGFDMERGAELRFQGVLTHVDRFARKVYVEYAQIL